MSDSEQSRFPIADYKDPGLPEYAENPLISALPQIMSLTDTVGIMSQRPLYHQDEADFDGHIRVHAIRRLTRNFFVPQTPHMILERKLSRLIRISYLGRNPKKAAFKRKLNGIRDVIQKQELTSYVNLDSNSCASSMAISGISGVGKTTATSIILNTYPRVIYHPDFHLLQVPWIKVDCPFDGALSEFCESFFVALDIRLNTQYRQKYMSGRPRIGKMIADVADLCLIHAIGLVVVDEFQHMNLAKSGGEKKMINFLVTLVNVVEVSVVLIGTPQALRLFSSEFRQARRASGEGSIIWDRIPFDDSWDDFLDELWPYQWLRSPVDRDESITKTLYDLTQGIPAIVVMLFCLAQARIILLAKTPEDESLSNELLEDVFDQEFSMVKSMLNALRTGDKRILDQCSDLVIPNIESALLNIFDRLKARTYSKRSAIDLGDASQTVKARSAIDALEAMDISANIATPLVTDLLLAEPDLDLLNVLQRVKETISQSSENKPMPRKKNTTSDNPTVKRENWNQLGITDLRKQFSEKTGTMYETLKEKGVIYPINEILAE